MQHKSLKPLALMVATAILSMQAVANQSTSQTSPTDLGTVTVSGKAGKSKYQVQDSAAATGLNLRLQETPQSVSVVTQQQIQDKKLTTIAETLAQTTGVNVSAVDSVRSRIATRGFGYTEQMQMSGLPVVFSSIGGAANLDLAMYDRIEVTRGATGLLTGYGEPSGSINLVRKRAYSLKPQGTIGAEAGSFGHQKVETDLQTPLNSDGTVRARVVASHLKAKGFQDNASREQSSVYLSLDADVGENTDVGLGVNYSQHKNRNVMWNGLPLFYADGSRTHFPRNKQITADWSDSLNKNLTVYADVTHFFANGVKWQTSAVHNRQNDKSNMLWVDGVPDRKTGLGINGSYDYWFSPARSSYFDSKLTVPFSLWQKEQEILVGLAYGKHANYWDTDDSEDESGLSDIHNWHGKFIKPAHRIVYNSHYETTQRAIYAASRLHLADPFKLILGGRFTHYRDVGEATKWGDEAYVQSERVITPYLGLVYDLNKNTTVYASYTSIFKPQQNKDKEGKFLKPVRGNSYEIGLKKQWLDGKLTTNLAFYQTKQNNFAEPDGKIIGTDQEAFKAIQGAKVKGYELEIVGKLTPQWDITASYAQFKTRSPDGEPLVSYAPRKTFKLLTKYDFSKWVKGLTAGGGVQWYSQPPKTVANPKTGVKEKVGNPAYALVDLMAQYQITPTLSAQFNLNNLFDRKYYQVNDWFDSLRYGEPRNVKFSINYQF